MSPYTRVDGSELAISPSMTASAWSRIARSLLRRRLASIDKHVENPRSTRRRTVPKAVDATGTMTLDGKKIRYNNTG